MEEINTSNTNARFSLIDDDLIQLANNNNSFYKQNVKSFILNMFLKTKIQHIAWHIFHSFSTMYPDEPTTEEVLRTKNFITKITNNLGIICSSCSSNNKDTFIQNCDIDLAVSSKTNIVQFFCDYHKYVNTTLRQQNNFGLQTPDIYTTEFIIDRYTKNDYISFIDETYKINLFALFQQNSMDDFFLLFHKNVKEIIFYKESGKYDFDIKFSTLL
jgi:hypothetical protein